MKRAITRREALRGIGAVIVAAGAPALGGCALSDGQIDARLAAGLAQLSGSSPAPTAVAAAAPLTRAEAVAQLRAGAGPRRLWLVTSHRVALRAFLARRREDDLAAGRVRWVNGWLLTETEIAAANL